MYVTVLSNEKTWHPGIHSEHDESNSPRIPGSQEANLREREKSFLTNLAFRGQLLSLECLHSLYCPNLFRKLTARASTMISNFSSAWYKILHLSVQWPLHNGNTAFPGLMCLSGISYNPVIINFYIDKSKCPWTCGFNCWRVSPTNVRKAHFGASLKHLYTNAWAMNKGDYRGLCN